MANATFKFLLPKINDLGVEEVLKIRQHVANTREGFSMHLQKLSAEVEARVQAGDTFEEISRYAQSVVETQLEPDYREFMRQLQAKSTGKIDNILNAAGQFLEIDASILTPKFYGQLLKAIGFMFGIDSETRMEKLTNRNQAYQFMRSVETTLK